MWDYLNIKVTRGGKLSSRERTELAVAGKIEVINNKLNLAPMLKNTAVVEGKKLMKYLRETHCVRLTCEEVAVVAIWVATRKELFPLSMRELAEAAGLEKNEVYPLLNRVAKYFSLPKKKPALESYVTRVISKVQRQARKYQISESYMLDLERESVQVLKEARANPKVASEVVRRSPILVAVAIVHVADENIGGKLTSKKTYTDKRKETLLNHLSGGGPSVTTIAKFLRNSLPNQPKISTKKNRRKLGKL
jgi:transcription initiation factor TFIIIB Brf1 subunit/transcription initiation factor TFIIB